MTGYTNQAKIYMEVYTNLGVGCSWPIC